VIATHGVLGRQEHLAANDQDNLNTQTPNGSEHAVPAQFPSFLSKKRNFPCLGLTKK
jgi:hypothetical protein